MIIHTIMTGPIFCPEHIQTKYSKATIMKDLVYKSTYNFIAISLGECFFFNTNISLKTKISQGNVSSSREVKGVNFIP